MKKIQIIFFIFFLGFIAIRCTTTQSQKEKDIAIIQEYIASQGLTDVQNSTTGLHYKIIDGGSGLRPAESSIITIKYHGHLVDGTQFDTSDSLPDQVLKTRLSSLIYGLREGLPKILSGGKIKLLVPSSLGYGDSSLDKIPANSVLIFDVDLLKVEI
ncbi:MAG: FKBP-type peptidyl-prolyl cis-trans isomerase [Saprospiraceae bacterium]|jgi:FKBP-type peptidyl-prolyl cis-trans isomerase|nr:FKBP-type peptidyl-prolyl cis-trans isomerase [Saprospiraceae bacterium]